MRIMLALLALLLFAVFWLMFTPIFFLAEMGDYVDKRISKFLDDLWEGF